MRYFKKITGERIYLSPMNPDDTEKYVKWLKDGKYVDDVYMDILDNEFVCRGGLQPSAGD